MYGIQVAELGGPEVLSYVQMSKPAPGAGEVLIKAEAIGVNFIDTYFRTGLYPHDLPFVLGAEVAAAEAAISNVHVPELEESAIPPVPEVESVATPEVLEVTAPDLIPKDEA